MNFQISKQSDEGVTDSLPLEIQAIASEALPSQVIFPNFSIRKATVMEHMRSYLPSSERAWALCEIYFEHAAWLYEFIHSSSFSNKKLKFTYVCLFRVHPITRDYLMYEILGPIYGTPSSTANGGGNSRRDRPESHELALLFMVFSLATLLDLKLPSNNGEAEFYHQLARAGLSCDPILVEPTVPAIQTLVSAVQSFN